MSSNNVAKNETAKVVENTLRSFEVFTFCPQCRKGVSTKAHKNINSLNLACCILLNPIWMCYQMMKVKDINCCDASHHCTACDAKLGNYSAC